METKWIKDLEHTWNEEAIRQAGQIIRDGGLVAFPTETVYGLGGDALNPDSSRKIYAARADRVIIRLSCISAGWRIFPRSQPRSRKMLKAGRKVLAGSIDHDLQKTDLVPKETTGGLDTVAVRFPDHKVALAFIEAAGGFVAAPSANTSGRPSPTLGKYVYEDMNGKIEMLLDGGQVGIGVESTIVDVTGEKPMILRPGYVTYEMMQEILPELLQDPTMFSVSGNAKPKAPGMKYKHYAPRVS